ncbi:hypothetical protein [Paraburkholderia hiiakae]|nr:hypothetical protein [Paraburkholderia hiiakae]
MSNGRRRRERRSRLQDRVVERALIRQYEAARPVRERHRARLAEGA